MCAGGGAVRALRTQRGSAEGEPFLPLCERTRREARNGSRVPRKSPENIADLFGQRSPRQHCCRGLESGGPPGQGDGAGLLLVFRGGGAGGTFGLREDD